MSDERHEERVKQSSEQAEKDWIAFCDANVRHYETSALEWEQAKTDGLTRRAHLLYSRVEKAKETWYFSEAMLASAIRERDLAAADAKADADAKKGETPA